MRTHYGPWQPCWISNQHQKHKSGRGTSNEHFWQDWFKSVQWFQRSRFKCEKLTDGRRMPSHEKSLPGPGLWPGELKKLSNLLIKNINFVKILAYKYTVLTYIANIYWSCIGINFFFYWWETSWKDLKEYLLNFLLEYFLSLV